MATHSPSLPSVPGNGDDKKDPYLRILVTGGCGFLGSHLCRRLVAEGHDVLAVDNFFTSQKTNVRDLLDKPNFEIVRHDITNPFSMEVDQIYNMACPASPVHYQYNPVKTMKTSIMGTMNMLGLAKRVKVRRPSPPRTSPATALTRDHAHARPPLVRRRAYCRRRRARSTVTLR